MKLLQVINSLATGGAEKLLLESVRQYKSRGLEVDVLVLHGGGYPFYEILKSETPIFELGKGSVYNPFHILRLMKFLRRYDVVHVHLFPALYWMAFAKFLMPSKAKLVFTEHSTRNRRMGHWLLRQLDRLVYGRYEAVVCITETIRQRLQKQFPSLAERFIVIENGIDLSQITQANTYDKTALQLPHAAFVLMQVASFQYPKDPFTIIRSLAHLPEQVHLVLVGQGPLRENAKAEATALGLGKRVHFLGVRTDVPALLKTADVLILSSAYEGLSLSSIEGMASGRPFIASDVPGLREIVGGAGVLFPVGDDKTLARIVGEFLKDENKRAEIAQSCQLRAAQYNIENMITSHLKLYQSLK